MRFLLAVIAILAVPAIAISKTIHVPGDYMKIQEAIDAAVDGDTVLVAPGTYVENIKYRGKAIVVKSSHGSEGTVIDGNQAGVKPLGLIDITVVRNGYGRQLFSFEADIDVKLGNSTDKVHASFIRAPKVSRVGLGVEVLALYNDEPVMVASGNILAASFHAETEDNSALLEWFIGKFL